MSLTKRYIDDLNDRADQGDEEAIRILKEAGLGKPADEDMEAAEAAAYDDSDAAY